VKKTGMKRMYRAIVVIGVATALAAAPAAASDGPVVSDPIVSGLAGPLQFEVSWNGTVLVGQSFSGTVSSISKDGTQTDLFNDPGVDGVSDGAFGSVIYTHTDLDNGVVELRVHTKSDQTKTIASTLDHESTDNPDQDQSYGLQGITDECAAQLPPDAGLVPYTGIVDSHPYAIARAPFGWLVADAAANDILFVSWFGDVKTVALLPAQDPIVVTAEAQQAAGLPDCVVGASYVTEAVPTDVEIGFDGNLYVSTLPGGPEDPSLGLRGGVYKVNPWTGKVRQIASGLGGAVNLAVSPRGDIYVSELFAGQVSKIVDGAPVPVVSVPAPSGLEWSRGKLYVATNTFESGEIRTVDV
jgi:hypothetical protein